MADDMNLHFKRVHFGIAPPNSLLSFSVTPGDGFAVQAVLDCDTKVVATWEWVEIQGGAVIEETLVPVGTYTLTLHVVFTGTRDSTVELNFGVGDKEKSRSMVGKKPDIGRALAVVFIQ